MAAKTLAEKNDMTTGGIFGKFVAYALPFMLTNLLQVLYNAADIIVVGLSGEPDAVGAVGTTYRVRQPYRRTLYRYSRRLGSSDFPRDRT